jgi:hypothetical protein
MKNEIKGKTIDEICQVEPGSFKQFVKKKEAHLQTLENERKERIRASRKAARALALAA